MRKLIIFAEEVDYSALEDAFKKEDIRCERSKILTLSATSADQTVLCVVYSLGAMAIGKVAEILFAYAKRKNTIFVKNGTTELRVENYTKEQWTAILPMAQEIVSKRSKRSAIAPVPKNPTAKLPSHAKRTRGRA